MKRTIRQKTRSPIAELEFDSVATSPASETIIPNISNMTPYSTLASSKIKINPLAMERIALSMKNSQRNSRVDCSPTQEKIHLDSSMLRPMASFLDLILRPYLSICETKKNVVGKTITSLSPRERLFMTIPTLTRTLSIYC